MPFKSNSQFDSLLAMTALFNDDELRALADECQNLIADREHTRREELRQELTGNLQKAINDIVHNGFNLRIENLDDPNWVVRFLPDESPYIEIEQRQRYFNFILIIMYVSSI